MTNPSELNEALVRKIRTICERHCRFSHSFEDLRFLEANATKQLAKALYIDLDKEFTEKGEDRRFASSKVSGYGGSSCLDLLFTSVPTKAGESLLQKETNVLGHRMIAIETKGIGHVRDSYIRIVYFNASNIWVQFGQTLQISPYSSNGPDEEKYILRNPTDDSVSPLTIPRAVWQGAIHKVAFLSSLLTYWRELTARPDSKAMQRSAKRFRAMAGGSEE
jgi:hypothetical protein